MTSEPQELRDEIEQTRADLGETVEALAAKTDVKARAKDAVDQAKADVTAKVAKVKDTADQVRTDVADGARVAGERTGQAVEVVREQVRRRPVPLLALAAGVTAAGVVGYLLWRRRR